MDAPTRHHALTARGGVVGITVCVVAAIVGIFIHDHSATPCECLRANYANETRCQQIDIYMKVPLVATHLIPFILVPVTMEVCETRAGTLQRMGMKNPTQVVQGLAYIMVSIAGEVGWHVHQRWFYHQDYDILNCFFYVFNTLGASYWALGAQTEATKSRILDMLLMLCTPLTVMTYAWGAYASSNSERVFGASKVPIYFVMTYQYGLLSWRLFKLLNNNYRVWLFPFFSVGMNLFFVILLDTFQSSLTLNPLFHILHDVAGTEMGVLVITGILWRATSRNSADHTA